MSSRSWCVLVVSMVGATLPLQAQQTEAELLRQIDSLAPLVEEAARAADAARLERVERRRSSIATRVQLDTIAVRGMTIVTPRQDAAAARALFEEVWDQEFGGLESRSLSQRTFTFQTSTYDVEEIEVDGVREQIVAARWHSSAEVKSRIRAAMARAVSAELGEVGLGRWVAGDPFTERDPAEVYREMVLAGSQAVRRCLAGAIDACSDALGLGSRADIVSTWYTPVERRDRVLAWAGYDPVRGRFNAPGRWTTESRRAVERCAGLETDDACDGFIDPAYTSWAPLAPHIRETVVARALELGGSTAWTRLLQDPEMAPGDALAYAAGAPLEELLEAWREWVVAGRPDVHAGLAGSGGLALLWILIFAALAARSTRWRFN
jgi:hypothetical protein